MDAGLWSLTSLYYIRILLTTNVMARPAYNAWVSEGTGDFNKLNEAFKVSFIEHMKKYFKYFINEKSLQFNYCYVLGFLAGTDNSDKNTYYKIMPYAAQLEENSNLSAWFNSHFTKTFDYSACHQLYFDGDDMDSILRTDNNSHLTKPYYIDRLHPYADEKPNDSLYEGMGNQLFNYVELAYEGTNELASVMNQIMIAATELIDESDTKGDKLVGGKSLWGFLNKYFFNIQRYFPQIAYLEQARIRYEFPELLGYISSGGGARSIRPITQSLGSQLQAELQYMNQRVIYMTSYAGFGAWGGDSTHSIGLADANETFGFMPANMPDGSGSTYTFTITPHQYIYPSYYLGQTFTSTHKRTSPKQTCTFTIAENLKDGGDTGIGICGINYISNLGDLGDKSVTSDIIVKGKRLTRLDINIGNNSFRAKNIDIQALNIEVFLWQTQSSIEYINLSHLIRLINIRILNNGAREVVFPKSSLLQKVTVFASEKINIEDVPNLDTLSVSYRTPKFFHIGANVGTNVPSFTVQPIVESIYSAQKTLSNPNLQSIHVENVNWTDFDVEALNWFADIPTCEFKGTIAIKEDDPYRPAVTWDLKNKFNAKFGLVDKTPYEQQLYKGLTLVFNRKTFDKDNARISGNYYVESGDEFTFKVKPYSQYENSQYSIYWRLETTVSGISLNSRTGVLKVWSLPNTQQFVTITAIVYSATEGGHVYGDKISKTIEIWNRPAQVGDLVYYDGTFSSAESYDGEKSVIGRCFYVAPRKADGSINEKFHNPNDKMTRLMVSCDDIKASSDTEEFTTWQWGAYNNNDNNSIFETLSDGTKKGLSIDGGVTTIYDVPNLRNLTSGGLTLLNGTSTSYITEESFRDSSDEGLDNDGFKAIAANYSMGDGFAYNESATYLNERKLDDVLLQLAGSGYSKGDIVNSGYAKTLRVIAHRNNILRTGLEQVGLEPDRAHFHIPTGDNELYELAKCISAIRIWAKSEEGLNDTEYGNRWSQLYYPVVSACYAYEPKDLKEGEILNPKFGKHNWFSIPGGMLARLCYYTYDYSSGSAVVRENSPMDTITDSKGKVLFKRITTSTLWSVTEYYSNSSWLVNFSNGSTYGNYKYDSYVGRAVSAF